VGAAEAADPAGWIIARYEDRQYVEGNDPCLDQVSAPTSLSFEYDRMAASRHAVLQAERNHASSPPAQKVSRRIAGSRFAHFRYEELSSGTGSAIFVSEALWMGRLPMMVGVANSCDLQPGDAGYTIAGWRFCALKTSSGRSSPPWDFHEALGEYFTIHSVDGPGRFESNTLLPTEMRGTFMREVTLDEMNQYVTLSSGVFQELGRVRLAKFTRDNLSPHIRAGDYVWINSVDTEDPIGQQGDYHGLLVAGWGIAQTCLDATTYLPVSLYESYNLALNSTDIPEELFEGEVLALTVPYVVDFTGNDPTTYLQTPLPRPFFCTRWHQFALSDPTRRFKDHWWWFYSLPDSLTLSTNQTYIDPMWSWSLTNP
jgi:hypothetical protein